jgi:hypothetical protein
MRKLDPFIICRRHAMSETECVIWHAPFSYVIPLGMAILTLLVHFGHDVFVSGLYMDCNTCRIIYQFAEPRGFTE